MTKFLKHYRIAAIAALGIIASCGDDKSTTPDVNFDRKAMLENIAGNMIAPGYQIFKTRVTELDMAIADFTDVQNIQNLRNLRTSLFNAYLRWQTVSVFEVGPAADISLRANLNTFPTDINRINANILSGSYNLDGVANWAAKGFPALEFLLYGAGSEEEVLKLYTEDADAFKRIEYLKAINADLQTKVQTVADAWSGSFKNTFINNTGTDVGSSLSQLVNQLNYDWEVIKNPKIGIPLGIKTMGTPLPKNVEGYYMGNSVTLAVENANAVVKLYKGGEGLGLDDYLNALNAKHGNITLDSAIQTQFSNTFLALYDVPSPLSKTVVSNQAPVQKAYQEFQKTVVLLKTDMPSALGVMITYQDADGD